MTWMQNFLNYKDRNSLILMRARTKEQAMKVLSDILCRTDCSSLTILRILIERIKNFDIK